jgi:uracil-DNA glycosylase
LVFDAFNQCPLKKLKVIIIGQDPYHGPNQANGLSFSVSKGVTIPPSLKNIFKEISNNIPTFTTPIHGDLSYWAKQGVLLLNAILTVEANKPGSHKKMGWEEFTNEVITKLNHEKTNLVFLLWGNFAQSKAVLIDANKHLVLTAAHPSPLARGAFFGNKHFSKTNAYLKLNNQVPIDWDLNVDLFSEKT